MKKLQLSFISSLQLNNSIIVTYSVGGVNGDLIETFVEPENARAFHPGINESTEILSINYANRFRFDYNADIFKGGLTITKTGSVLNLTSTDTTVTFHAVSGTAISSGKVTYVLSDPVPAPLPIQNLKYYFEFNDVVDVRHRVEILSAEFDGEPTKIYGSCSLEYSETDDTLEPIRGSGLKIDLQADSNLTFYDLYSEEERTYSVTYKRDTLGTNTTLFNGWLSPEGIYESLVTDKWVISLDCTDGLGFLKNLSYVEDANGLSFVGKQSLVKIVSNCLKRTKISSNIFVGIDIYYEGLRNDLSIFENVYYNSDRFVKDDKDTIMNCDEVLRSVLEPFGAVITAYKGQWLIYKPNSLVTATIPSFFGYDFSGDNLLIPKKNFDFRVTLGSQINGYYPHHVNANQQKTVKSSIGAFRINYKYGLVDSLLGNENLTINNGVLTGYNIINNNAVTLNTDKGFKIIKDPSTPYNVLESNGTTVDNGTELQLNIVHTTNSVEVTSIRVSLQLNVNGTIYSNIGGEWIIGAISKAFRTLSGVQTSSEIKTPPTPESGVIKLVILTNKVFTPPGEDPPTSDQITEFISIRLEPTAQNLLKGENHTFQRELRPSSKIKDIKEVFNGDNPNDTYLGTIYKTDKTTPTENWNRLGVEEKKPILKIMGEERMKMYGKPLQVYSGDIFGYFDYLNLATISNFNGVFMVTSYRYDCLSNVTSITYVEVLDTDILEDVDYQFTLDYGNVVEPTIRG